jgi:hypothetical protein
MNRSCTVRYLVLVGGEDARYWGCEATRRGRGALEISPGLVQGVG